MTGPVIHDDGSNPDRASRDHAMRFDLVDLQLFVSVADARSITGGADRVHLALASASERIKGLEGALGVALLTRGRRGVALTAAGENLLDHARLILHNVETMRGDLARFASGVRASVHLLANTVGLSEHLPKALAAFLRDNPVISVDVEERESTDIAAAIASGAADLGFAAEHALPDTIERFVFGEDRLALVAPRRGPFAGRRQIDFQEVAAHDFIGLTQATALQLHIAKHAARLGLRLQVRARLRDFDAICQMVAADVGIAVVPEAAARRCARMMPIATIRIRDAWANRKLVICARSFKALPRPARLLVEHLRAAAR
jgi:DNA-binding transcriptional LysR family regulator